MAFPIFLWGVGAAGAAAATLITKVFLDDDSSSKQSQSSPPVRSQTVARDSEGSSQGGSDPFCKLRYYLQQHDVKCDARFNRRLASYQSAPAEKRAELTELCCSRFEETQAMVELVKELRTAKVSTKKTEKALFLLKELVDSAGRDVNAKEISK